MMEGSEVVSSAASGSDGFTPTENEDTLSETCSEEETLNLVEGAILRMLKRYSSQKQNYGSSPERHSESAKRVEAGTRSRGKFNNEEQHSADSVNAPPARSSNPEDMDLLANLLEQVHTLRRNQRQGSRRPEETFSTEVEGILKPIKSFDRRRGEEKKSPSSSTRELRETLEAAAMAAKAAADAAQAAAVSVVRNTEAIEFIVKSMKSSKKRQKAKNATASDEKKAILKSSQITNWMLGFMAVTTIVWRFGVVNVVKGVANKFSDPLGYVGKLVGGNDEESEEKPVEKSAENGNLLDKFSDVDMPSMFQNDPDHNDTKSEEKPVEKSAEKGNLLDKLSNVDLPSMFRNDSDHKGTKSEEKPIEKSAEKGNLLDKLSNVDLPTMFRNDSDHKDTKFAAEKKGKETKSSLAKSAATVDVKSKEAGKEVEKTAFGFANLLQVKPKEK